MIAWRGEKEAASSTILLRHKSWERSFLGIDRSWLCQNDTSLGSWKFANKHKILEFSSTDIRSALSVE